MGWHRAGLLAGVTAAGLAGCAVAPSAPQVLVLPGVQKSAAQFDADQAVCRTQAQASVAPGVDAANQQAAATAIAGTAIGAVIGALFGYGGYGSYGHYAGRAAAWGAGAGMMVGGAVAGSGSQAAYAGLQQRYDHAFAQCMLLHGNPLPGVAGHARERPALPPPPPGYRAPTVPPPNRVPPSIPPPNTPPPAGA